MALRAVTSVPAFQLLSEEEIGSLEVGKLADFVILSGDPTAIDPERLDTLQVLETIKEDRVVWDAAAR